MLKKMTLIKGLLAGLLPALLMLAAGCDGNRHADAMRYNVTCTLDAVLHRDSATLLVLEENYNKLRVCGTSLAQGETFTFSGQTDVPKVALIRWDEDSTRPFYFVLEPGDTRITIKPGSWSIGGSRLNKEYQHFANRRNAIMNARAATWQEYLKMAADSSLKRDDELRLVRQDSLLNDSLQRITVERINRGDAVGRIIRERYARQLDQEHMRQLR